MSEKIPGKTAEKIGVGLSYLRNGLMIATGVVTAAVAIVGVATNNPDVTRNVITAGVCGTIATGVVDGWTYLAELQSYFADFSDEQIFFEPTKDGQILEIQEDESGIRINRGVIVHIPGIPLKSDLDQGKFSWTKSFSRLLFK